MVPYNKRPLRRKYKFIVTTKAELATDKVNDWVEAQDDILDILETKPIMSYTSINGKGAMMIGCMIEYLVVRESYDDDEGEDENLAKITPVLIEGNETLKTLEPKGEQE